MTRSVVSAVVRMDVHLLNSTRRRTLGTLLLAVMKRGSEWNREPSDAAPNEPERGNAIDFARCPRLPRASFRRLWGSQGGRAARAKLRPAMTHNAAKLVFWGVRGSTPTL